MLVVNRKGTSYFETIIHLFKANVGPGKIVNKPSDSRALNNKCYYSMFCYG